MWLLLNVQGKDTCSLKQPAAGLVRLALDRWQLRGMRADNISAIVVIMDSADSVSQPNDVLTAKCRDTSRPTAKDVLHRVRFRHQRRLGLRTVLGKICRLRAQRNLCVVRSPLGSCNQLSAALQPQRGAGMNDEAALRRPRRRHSYQEACSGGEDAGLEPVLQRRPRVVLRRLSVDVSRSSAQLSDDVNDDGHRSDDDDMSVDDVGAFEERGMMSEQDVEADDAQSDPEPLLDGDSVFKESILRLSENDLTDGSDLSEPVQLLGPTAGGRIEDDGWEIHRCQSVVDLPSLPPDIQCVSA